MAGFLIFDTESKESMPRGGKRDGAGRRKGAVNKVTREMRPLIQAFIEHNLESAQELFDEVRYGIEIEKTLPDGRVITGRLNADPKGAFDLLLKGAEFCFPKLGRVEHTGEEGGPIVVEILEYKRPD